MGSRLVTKGSSSINKGDNLLDLFDKVIQTKKGFVLGVYMIPIKAEMAAGAQDPRKKCDTNMPFQILGHCGEVSLRLTAKASDWELTRKFNTCVYCVGQKNISKNWTNGSTVPVDVNIISIKGECYGGASFRL